MILGLYQTASPAGDVPAGLAVTDKALAEAAAAGVDMLVMPELFLPGYNTAVQTGANAGDVIGDVKTMCTKHGVALTIGVSEEADGNCYNSAISIGADGAELAMFRKIQLFGPGENAAFAPGDAYCVFDYRGTRFGVLICYDVEFAPHVRALVQKGVQVILVPTANMKPFVNVHQLTVPVRALENRITIVYANYCGTEGDLDYTGLSGIFGPDGYPLACKGANAGLCVAELPGEWSERSIPLSTQLADFREIEP